MNKKVIGIIIAAALLLGLGIYVGRLYQGRQHTAAAAAENTASAAEKADTQEPESPAETSAAADSDENKTESLTLEENESCRIQASLLSDSRNPLLVLLIENLTEGDFAASVEMLSVNNCMVKGPAPITVPSGGQEEMTIPLLKTDLDAAGISDICEVGMLLQIPDVLYGHYTLSMAEDSGNSSEETIGTPLVENDVCLLTLTGFNPEADINDAMPFSYLGKSGQAGYGIQLRVYNRTDMDVSFSAADVLVDGRSAGGAWMRTVSPGMMACVDVVIPYGTVSEEDIQAGTLQMAVEVHELDTYAELASETIEITVE